MTSSAKPRKKLMIRVTAGCLSSSDSYHKFSGIAVEVGKSVTHVKVGDRIMADNGMQCGSCRSCQNNLPLIHEQLVS